jgi:molybdopterin synthase catalytic subunit
MAIAARRSYTMEMNWPSFRQLPEDNHMENDRGKIAVTGEDIDTTAYIEAAKGRATGAIVTFLGVVRDDTIESIEIEAYDEVALQDLTEIRDEAVTKYDLQHVTIVHRVGMLQLGDTILLIVVSAGHRKQAFLGCESILERIKERAPFWKRELLKNGERWVKGNME